LTFSYFRQSTVIYKIHVTYGVPSVVFSRVCLFLKEYFLLLKTGLIVEVLVCIFFLYIIFFLPVTLLCCD